MSVPSRSFALGLLIRVLIGLVPGFLAADALVGLLDGPQGSDESLWLEDEQLGWVPRPGYSEPTWGTQVDRFGLRTPEIPADAPERELRILGLGASRIWGARNVRQQDTWPYFLEAQLAERSDLPVRVLNGGVQAYSISQAARRGLRLLDAERDGVRVDPDLVFLALTPGAQAFIDNSQARRWVRVGGRLVEQDVVAGWPAGLVPLRVAVHRLLMHSNLYVRHRAKLRGAGVDGDRPTEIQRWTLTRREDPPFVREAVDQTFEEVVALRDACRERGIGFVALLLPTEAQDGDDRWDHYCSVSAQYGAPPPGTPRREGVEVLAERCAALGIEAWDLTPVVEVFAEDRPRWYADDLIHWSGRGHYLVARGIAKALTANGWFPRLRARELGAPGPAGARGPTGAERPAGAVERDGR